MGNASNCMLDVITLLHAVHDINNMGSSLRDCPLTSEDSRCDALILMAREKCQEAIALIDASMAREEVQHD